MVPPQAHPAGNRGVSNVIAVVLVVGMTVVLATVAAVGVTGLGGGVEKPPDNVRLSTDYDDDHAGDGETLTLEHQSGDTLAAAKVRFDVDGATTTGGSPVDVVLDTTFADEVGSDDVLRAGESIVLDRTDFETVGGGNLTSIHLDLSDADVRLIWRASAEATSSSTIYHCDVEHPDCANRD